jgi:hypothetical protein
MPSRGSSSPVVKVAPNTLFFLGRSAKWRRPSCRHFVRYCIKCAVVRESLKTVLDASLPSHALELRPSSVYRKLYSRRVGCINRQECHGFGKFLWLAETLHRNGLGHLNVDLI